MMFRHSNNLRRSVQVVAILVCLLLVSGCSDKKEHALANARVELQSLLHHIKWNGTEEHKQRHQNYLAALEKFKHADDVHLPMIVDASLDTKGTPKKGTSLRFGLGWVGVGFHVHGFYIVNDRGRKTAYPHEFTWSSSVRRQILGESGLRGRLITVFLKPRSESPISNNDGKLPDLAPPITTMAQEKRPIQKGELPNPTPSITISPNLLQGTLKVGLITDEGTTQPFPLFVSTKARDTLNSRHRKSHPSRDLGGE